MPILERLVDARNNLLPNRTIQVSNNSTSATKVVTKTAGQTIPKTSFSSVRERLAAKNTGRRITEVIHSKVLTTNSKSQVQGQTVRDSDINIDQ